MNRLAAHATAALFAFALPAGAAPIPLVNPSFEDPPLAVGQVSQNLAGWQETGGPASNQGFREHIAGFAANGTTHLGMELGHQVWQDTGTYYEENGHYTFQFAYGNRPAWTNSANKSEARLTTADGIDLNVSLGNAGLLPEATFSDFSSNAQTVRASTAAGKEIRILLAASGAGRSHFDHIRLDGDLNPYTQAVLRSGPAAYYQFNGAPTQQRPGFPPNILSAEARGPANEIWVTFSEPVQTITATDPFNYVLGGGIWVDEVQQISPSEVRLILGQDLPTNSGVSLEAQVGDLDGDGDYPPFGQVTYRGGGQFPARDTSGNANHALYANGLIPTATSAGVPGRWTGAAAEFDGDDDIVRTPALLSDAAAATFEAWVRLDADVAVGCCASLYSPDGFSTGTPHFNITPGYGSEVGISSRGNISAGPLPQGRWFHYAVVIDTQAGDTGTVEFFVDGSSQGGPLSYGAQIPNLNLGAGQLGGWAGDGNRNLNGALDDVAIYPRALTAAEIAEHYEASRIPPQTLIHYQVNSGDAASVAGGAVPNSGTLGNGVTGTGAANSVPVTLSGDIPTREEGRPEVASDRSLACAGVGGVNAPGTRQLSNAAIAAAGGFTYEAWFKYTGGGDVNSIIDYAGTEKLDRRAATSGVEMQTNNGIFHYLGDAAAGGWHYVAAVFTATGPVAPDGMLTGDYTYYLDGLTPIRTDTGITKSTFGDSLNRTIGVGMHPQGPAADFFNGLIYEPRVTLGALRSGELLFTPPPLLGDTNRDGQVDISDAVALTSFLFLGGAPVDLDASDANGDGNVDINDGVSILNSLFNGPSAIPDTGDGTGTPTGSDLFFVGPSRKGGAPGTTIQVPVEVYLATGTDVSAWSFGVIPGGGASIAEATVLGTVAADVSDGPPGLRDGGYEVTEPSAGGGVVSAVQLSLTQPIVISDPSSSPILALILEGPAPAEGETATWTLDFAAGQQGFGSPVPLRVTSADGQSFVPTPHSYSVTIGNSPPNDNLADATEVGTTAEAALSGTNRFGSAEPGEFPDFANSVWHSWTAPANAMVTIDTAGSSFDTVLTVYAGETIESLTLIANNDDALGIGVSSRVSFFAAAGATYRIRIRGFNSAQGDYALNISQVPEITDLTYLEATRRLRVTWTSEPGQRFRVEWGATPETADAFDSDIPAAEGADRTSLDLPLPDAAGFARIARLPLPPP